MIMTSYSHKIQFYSMADFTAICNRKLMLGGGNLAFCGFKPTRSAKMMVPVAPQGYFLVAEQESTQRNRPKGALRANAPPLGILPPPPGAAEIEVSLLRK
jgi:hypothetical protein